MEKLSIDARIAKQAAGETESRMDRRKFLATATALLTCDWTAAFAMPWSSCALPSPPVTAKRPKRIVQLGSVRVDDYAWLKDPNWKEVWRNPATLNPAIKAHLEAENAYADKVLAPTLPLQHKLFQEMLVRSGGDESAPPIPDGPWLYFSRFPTGAQHPSWYRRRRDGTSGDELLLDGEARAKGRAYFNIVNAIHSPDQKLFAWAEDAHGSEKFQIFVKDLETGTVLPNPALSAFGDFVFSPDSQWIFWVWRNENSRPAKVFRRPARGCADTLVYEEHDPAFLMAVSCTAAKSYVMIRTWNAESSEVRLISADTPTAEPRIVEPRAHGLVYSVEDWKNRFVILTNADGAVDFKLMWADRRAPARRSWREWVPYRPGTFIIGMQPFRDYFVRIERIDANAMLVVTRTKDLFSHTIVFDEPAYAVTVSQEQEYASSILRYVYQSPRQPKQWTAYDMTSNRADVLKTQSAGPGFDKNRYVVERLFATANDGARVPITLLRKRETKLNGSVPLLMYGYGSYGAFVEPVFSGPDLSLIDRGWVYAIAHVRGGSAKGWSWFLQARRLHKTLTFTDFISCAEHLIESGYGHRGGIVIHGFSAGGLLVGVVNNMRPDLWAGVIAQAPFVDMLNTMSDPTHPLVPLTRPDWGDPLADVKAYDYIASYSPYENVKAQRYSPVLATTSVSDDRVGYWEPAKWIAKLRASSTSGNPMILKTEMEGGHGGAAGRLAELRQTALFYAFAIWTATRHCGKA